MTPLILAIAKGLQRRSRTVLLLAWLSAATPLAAQPAPPWPDTDVARLQALALMQTLNAEILASPSATRTLQHWCQQHRLAAEPRIVAVRLPGPELPPTAEQRQRLELTQLERVRHRRVQLRCGQRLLAQADNWYVPGRLSAAMNRLLTSTDLPFGQVVAPLKPYRRTAAMRLLWQPLPEDWPQHLAPTPQASSRPLAIPAELFEHRAVVFAADHRPLAEVVEVYQRQILPQASLASGS